jgi:hypothetical protein
MFNEIKETVSNVVNQTIEASKEAMTDVVWVYDREGLLVPKYIQRAAMASGDDNPRGWK